MPNPSFEFHTNCPSAYSQLAYCLPWFSPSVGTPDLFDSCGTFFTLRVPGNAQGFQYARTGVAYAGIFVSQRYLQPNIREYLSVQLTQPLTKGNIYRVGFYASLCDSSSHGTNKLGAYLSDTNILPANGWVVTVKPQILNAASNSLMNYKNWVRIQGFYKAKGGEKYLTIGNFFNDSASAFKTLPGRHSWDISYYYIDDVEVIACNELDGNCREQKDYEIGIFPNPSPGDFTVNNPFGNDVTLKVYNDIGQLIFEKVSGDTHAKITLQNCANGMYFLQILDANQHILKRQVLLIKH